MMPVRQEQLVQLKTQSFDLLIIGGGIVGAGIARDAVMRGLKVALVEQGDFAGGTSSKTSKLIHGGLRYLEQGRLRLVQESLRERRILREIAPTLVRASSLLLPVYRADVRPAWKIRLGLALYDLLARGDSPSRPHRWLNALGSARYEPRLLLEGLRGAGLYTDCQMDDARLCLMNVLQAVSFGAVCCNYVRLQALRMAQGVARGGVVEDVLGGDTFEVTAEVVVNATGPWADRVRRLSDPAASPRLAPTKGTHVVLPKLTEHAVFVQAKADGRMLFVLPWQGQTLVGTTESPMNGPAEQEPDALAASGDEVAYLLREVNRLFPLGRVTPNDVVATFAGARPLLGFHGSSTRASREHRVDMDRSGLISVMGGKYTTYRLMARQTVDLLVGRWARRFEGCLTDQVNLMESAQPVMLERWQELTRTADSDLLARLLGRYGTGAFRILDRLARDPSLGAPVCPHHAVLQAELAHALEEEMACTVTDLLARRTPIAWSACHGLEGLPAVSSLLRRIAGLSEAIIERQVEAYQRFLAQGLSFRARRASAVSLAPAASLRSRGFGQ